MIMNKQTNGLDSMSKPFQRVERVQITNFYTLVDFEKWN